MNWRFGIAFLAGCSSSISEVSAADVREVMRIIEQDEARVCELQTAKEKMYRACPGSPERAHLESKLRETEAAIERERKDKNQTLEELNALMQPLSIGEKNQIWARVNELRERCYGSFGPYPEPCPEPAVQIPSKRRYEPILSPSQGVQAVPSESTVR